MSYSGAMIGKTITKMMIADDNVALLFVTDQGKELVARADADCCSYTWIESVELPALGLPFTIQSIEALELNSHLDDRNGELQFYGCKVVTDKGDMIIDYRNESNGYYGGNLNWPDDSYFYGGVHGQNISTCKWIEIRDAG